MDTPLPVPHVVGGGVRKKIMKLKNNIVDFKDPFLSKKIFEIESDRQRILERNTKFVEKILKNLQF